MILTTSMAHPRKLIRDAVVALLIGANTAAGARVSSTRFDPYRQGDLPAISVYTLSESTDPDSADTAPIELTRNLKLTITGFVAHTTALPVADAMDSLAEQIEAAMAANYWLTRAAPIAAVDHATGRLTLPAHGLTTAGSPLTVAGGAGGVPPAGLMPGVEYWAIVVDANTLELATSISNALAGNALSLTDNGTLPLQLLVGTAGDQMLEACDMEVVEGDGKSDPLVGVVELTYAITYRTRPAEPTDLGEFTTVDTTYQVEGGVPDTVPAEDTFTEEAP